MNLIRMQLPNDISKDIKLDLENSISSSSSIESYNKKHKGDFKKFLVKEKLTQKELGEIQSFTSEDETDIMPSNSR